MDMLKNSKWLSRVIIDARVKMMNIQILQKLWFYTTYTRVCQRNFIYFISILPKFVLFEYNHVVIVIETCQYSQESDFYEMSQYDIIMFIMSMQNEIYLLNLYLSC